MAVCSSGAARGRTFVPMSPVDCYEKPCRIAIIRPSALGDVCRTVPALVSLRRAWPDARVEWIVQDQFVDSVASHPALDEAIPFPRKRFAMTRRSIQTARSFLRWSSDLRARRYDTVFDLQGLARSGLITWLTRAPRRVGFRNAREGAAVAYNRRHFIDDSMHTVDRMLALLEREGVESVRDMRLYTAAADRDWWSARRRATGLQPDADYAVLAPTARWASKRWPAERFAELIDPLIEREFQRIVIVGAAGERDQCAAILNRCRNSGDDRRVAIDLIGATTVGQLMAVIEEAGLVIANDSAALHMAVGFDRRYLGLYGPTDVDRVGPYKGSAWVIQRIRPGERLHHKDSSLGASIMERITVQDVLRKLDHLLSDRPLAAAK